MPNENETNQIIDAQTEATKADVARGDGYITVTQGTVKALAEEFGCNEDVARGIELASFAHADALAAFTRAGMPMQIGEALILEAAARVQKHFNAKVN